VGTLLRPEFLGLLLIALVFFGAKRLPEAGAAVGKTIKEFQKSMREVTEPDQPAPAVMPPSQPQQLSAAPATTLAPQNVVDPASTDRPSTSAQ
jgi:sec-independent protein translocase protein TatA